MSFIYHEAWVKLVWLLRIQVKLAELIINVYYCSEICNSSNYTTLTMFK